jgi:hypothetical protein
MRTLKETGYGLAGQLKVFTIPKGMWVVRASNLSLKEGKPRYWLKQIPPRYKKDYDFLGLYHGYGILLEYDEVGR